MTRDEIIQTLEAVKRMRSTLPHTKYAIDRAIKSLEKEWEFSDHKEADIKKDDMLRVLFNRCRALTQYSLCMWCGIKNECESYK